MIKFANKLLPSFVKVRSIKYSILPNLEHKTQKIYGRAGEYDFGTEIGKRMIDVDVMLIAENQNDVMKKARELTSFLFYSDLQPLILMDEPDKLYMARIDGSTDVTELYNTGTTTLRFVCPTAYAESLQERSLNWSPVDYTPVNVTNNGTVETYPVMDIRIKQDTTSISVLKEDKFIKVGSDDTVGKTPIDTEPLVLHETMDTYTGFGTGISIDGGIIQGSLSSTGFAVQQTNKDYGTNANGWHGGAGVRTLPRQLQDFQVTARVQFKDYAEPNAIGRVEVYLLDENNVIFGKVAIVDNDPGMSKPRIEARAGSASGGNMFVNSHGDKKGVFADFDGVLQIAREGRTWSAYIAKVDANGVHHTRLYKTWYDSKNEFSTKKLAKFQVHIGANGEKTPVRAMYLTDLKVYEKNIAVNYDTHVPITFKAGDTVTIDNQKAIVLKNGQPIFTDLDPSSDFFALEEGTNGLLMSPPVGDAVIRFKERWL